MWEGDEGGRRSVVPCELGASVFQRFYVLDERGEKGNRLLAVL